MNACGILQNAHTDLSPILMCLSFPKNSGSCIYVEGCRHGFSLSGLRILRHRPGAGDHGFQSWLSQQLAV